MCASRKCAVFYVAYSMSQGEPSAFRCSSIEAPEVLGDGATIGRGGSMKSARKKKPVAVEAGEAGAPPGRSGRGRGFLEFEQAVSWAPAAVFDLAGGARRA